MGKNENFKETDNPQKFFEGLNTRPHDEGMEEWDTTNYVSQATQKDFPEDVGTFMPNHNDAKISKVPPPSRKHVGKD